MKKLLVLASLAVMLSLSGCGGLGGLLGGNLLAPDVSSINPISGPAGTTVTITGNYLNDGTVAYPVTFNGHPSGPTNIVDSTHITAVVPVGATTGPVIVTNTTLAATGANGASSGITFTVN